ncbi:TRAM domain-containing protein [Patescibacteria group bacterium]|nr:TRAM domain-containing protein [Patescibacteria group bacterium]
MSAQSKEVQNTVSESAESSAPLLLRVIVSILSAILGYNFSRTAFFREYPLFGVRYVGELMSLILAGSLGYFALPTLLIQANKWFEKLVSNAISDIVSKFWEEQSKRIQEARRDKQRQQAQEKKDQLKSDLENALLVDTSVLVDGRILDIIRAGFLNRTLIVSQNVIDELHLISDSKDKIKRQRGRRGLDVVKKLKKHVRVINPQIKGKKKGVDKTLVSFAKEHNLTMMTLDYNLSKVADVLGIKVLNVNNLVNALKTVLLPGEEIEVEIIQEGKEKNQGVGYLNDGTMIVVSESKDKVGTKVNVIVKKVIQSAAGKMIFCDLVK